MGAGSFKVRAWGGSSGVPIATLPVRSLFDVMVMMRWLIVVESRGICQFMRARYCSTAAQNSVRDRLQPSLAAACCSGRPTREPGMSPGGYSYGELLERKTVERKLEEI
jgi:hypothetical protein